MKYFCHMSGGEIVVILFIYLLLFGAKGIPSLAQTLGKAVYQFRNAAKDVQTELMQSAQEIKKQAEIKLDQMDIDTEPRRTTAKPNPEDEKSSATTES